MKFSTSSPPVRQLQARGAQYRKDLRAAAIIATDRASKDAQRGLQERIRGAGLGKLGGAVGQTSMRKERQGTTASEPYGVIFARGGDESQAGGTLEAYSRGATIVAQQVKWLAFATSAIPRFVTVSGRRFRTTPQLYNNSSLVSSIGKLIFKPIGPNRAVLVIRRASVNIRTGRARTPLKRRSKVSTLEKDVVAFVLIRQTTRAKRFDKDQTVRAYAIRMPRYMADALREVQDRRGGN